MFMQATQMRVGAIILYQNDLYRVMDLIHITPGNKRGFVQTKMRNLRTGLQTENKFRSDDKIERAVLDTQEMEYLYESGGAYHFMNSESYEQLEFSKELLGDAIDYLTPNLKINVDMYEGQSVGVTLPKTVNLEVADTPRALKGATVNNELKPATMETGLAVRVPGFIEIGETVRVDTETGNYLSRAK